MPLIFGFELIVSALIVFVLIYAPIMMAKHIFRTYRLQRKAKKMYPDDVSKQHAYFQTEIYK
jgi:hypothetical protein